jgi:hypothetical protein
MSSGSHLASEEVAAYLDNTLSDAECALVRAHLADCDACRQEIVSVSTLLDRGPRLRRRRIALSSLAAVAAALTFFVVRPPPHSNLPGREPVRGRDMPLASEGVSGVRAIAPIGRQTNGAGTLFVWHSSAPGTTYRLTVTDDRGRKVWSGSTNDTTLALSGGSALAPDRGYNWYVDALLPDGSTATTGISSFKVVR